jgi:hypothetical protein
LLSSMLDLTHDLRALVLSPLFPHASQKW